MRRSRRMRQNGCRGILLKAIIIRKRRRRLSCNECMTSEKINGAKFIRFFTHSFSFSSSVSIIILPFLCGLFSPALYAAHIFYHECFSNWLRICKRERKRVVSHNDNQWFNWKVFYLNFWWASHICRKKER